MEPRCDEFSKTAKIAFSLIAIAVVMIMVMSITCVLKAKTIKVLLFIKCSWSFGRRLETHGREQDVFVVYYHDGPDADFVLQELLPLLDRYDITTATEDCFALGTFFTHHVLYTTSLVKTSTQLQLADSSVSQPLGTGGRDNVKKFDHNEFLLHHLTCKR